MSAKKTLSSKRPFAGVVFVFAAVLATGQMAWAQVDGNEIDWSTRHMVFSNPGTESEAQAKGKQAQWLKVIKSHRYDMQVKRRSASATVATRLTESTPETSGASTAETAAKAAVAKNGNAGRDWTLSLGGGTVAANQYPATFSTVWSGTVSGPANENNCLSDFAVFGLNLAGTSTQANLVAIDNLYSGSTGSPVCGAAPTFKWAYNVTTLTGGTVTTSPIMTLDGTLVAFIESNGSASVFHVLKWADATGTASVTAPTALTTTTATSVRQLHGSLHGELVPGSTPIMASSPYYDFEGTDTAYIGNNNGQLFAITGVFNGTPALSAVNGFNSGPVQVAASGVVMSSPVLDDYYTNYVFIGGSDGKLYAVSATTPARRVPSRSETAAPGVASRTLRLLIRLARRCSPIRGRTPQMLAALPWRSRLMPLPCRWTPQRRWVRRRSRSSGKRLRRT